MGRKPLPGRADASFRPSVPVVQSGPVPSGQVVNPAARRSANHLRGIVASAAIRPDSRLASPRTLIPGKIAAPPCPAT